MQRGQAIVAMSIWLAASLSDATAKNHCCCRAAAKISPLWHLNFHPTRFFFLSYTFYYISEVTFYKRALEGFCTHRERERQVTEGFK